MFNPNGKRARNEPDDEKENFRDQKRIHTLPLPFRTSPTTKHSRPFFQLKRNAPKPLFTQTITPAESEDEISPHAASMPPFEPTQSQQAHSEIEDKGPSLVDEEMDLASPKQEQSFHQHDIDAMMLSPNPSPCSLLPSQISKLGTSETNSGGRLPTPIYSHFRQSPNVRVNTSPVEVQSQPSPDEEYEKHTRARRLPTPISEDEAMDTFDQPSSGAEGSSNATFRQPVQPLRRPVFQPFQTGKPMFSMGFRADCDMCRDRVPGHYNHIFRT